MKVTCGTDIIEIYRIRESIEELGEAFLKRIYSLDEIEYCESRKKQKYQHYAARFAAKEATFKAISSLLPLRISFGWKDIEVTKDGQGRPSIVLAQIIQEQLKQYIENIDISLSHCNQYATANVVVLWREGNES
jgi:holo-[acyl-carrier protein] synthase